MSILPAAKATANPATFDPGATAVLADLPWGRLGMSICYDLRFPALYRALATGGADMIAVPAAFTRQTGEAHWHVAAPRPRHRDRRICPCRLSGWVA